LEVGFVSKPPPPPQALEAKNGLEQLTKHSSDTKKQPPN
jgi:hypothetical protein